MSSLFKERKRRKEEYNMVVYGFSKDVDFQNENSISFPLR